jgi:hypothetical protein
MTIALTSAREIPAGLLSKITRSKKIGKKSPNDLKELNRVQNCIFFQA